MIKRLPGYIRQLSRFKYAERRASDVYHIADKNGCYYYLCRCSPSFRYKGGVKHCFGRVSVPVKLEWSPKKDSR